MKIETLTAVVGTKACNAHCSYCVSKMTPDCGPLSTVNPEFINWRNFKKGCRFARDCGVSTLLLTGKGEPTLHPELITKYMEQAQSFDFPFIELQTNGIAIDQDYGLYKPYLEKWYELGMSTVSVSIAHYNKNKNAEIFTDGKEYEPWRVVVLLHDVGFFVRINCVMMKDYIEDGIGLSGLMNMCKKFKVEQTTIRSIARPENSESEEVAKWVDDHQVSDIMVKMKNYVEMLGAVKVLELPHGAVVYDWNGQNICINNCLTSSTDPENIRQLIFFPDGSLRYDWKYEGAIIL